MPRGNPHAFRIGFSPLMIVPVNAFVSHDVISLEETLEEIMLLEARS
jgi:hypothetical protein